ncbi:MAG: hypothetical protein ACYTFT_02455 [Planctomycetota bacterium]|jgi:hypothetical protein
MSSISGAGAGGVDKAQVHGVEADAASATTTPEAAGTETLPAAAPSDRARSLDMGFTMLEDLNAQLDAADSAGPAQLKAGDFELPWGGALNVGASGDILVRLPDEASSDPFERHGMSYAGESGMLQLPKLSGPEHREAGNYQIPFGGSLQVHGDGMVAFEPNEGEAELEAAGWTWVGETGALAPPGPGSFELPGGGTLHVRGDGEMLLEPPENSDGLEMQGFTWAGETGYMSFPKKSGLEHTAPGAYPLYGGAMLHVADGEAMLEPPNYDGTDQLEDAGFTWAGETGFLSLPTR